MIELNLFELKMNYFLELTGDQFSGKHAEQFKYSMRVTFLPGEFEWTCISSGHKVIKQIVNLQNYNEIKQTLTIV